MRKLRAAIAKLISGIKHSTPAFARVIGTAAVIAAPAWVVAHDVFPGGASGKAPGVTPNSVALGTDTTGNYCALVSEGAAIDVSGAAGEGATFTVAVDSSEAGFLASGALTCGASTAGKAQVHTTPLQYCDNAATPTLQYAAYADSAGSATAISSAVSVPADSTVTLTGGPAGWTFVGAGGLSTVAPMVAIKSSDNNGVACLELQPDKVDDTADHLSLCYDGTNFFVYAYSAYPGTPVAYETLNYTTGQKTFGFDVVANGGLYVGDAVTDVIRLNGPINNNLAGAPTGCTVAGGVCVNDPLEVMGAVVGGAGTLTALTVTGSAPNGDTVLTSAACGTDQSIGAAGDDFTLPTPTSGCRIRFIVDANFATTNMTVVTASSANIIYGAINVNSTLVGCAARDTVSFVNTAELIGDWAEFRADGTNWYVSGIGVSAGSITCTLAS